MQRRDMMKQIPKCLFAREFVDVLLETNVPQLLQCSSKTKSVVQLTNHNIEGILFIIFLNERVFYNSCRFIVNPTDVSMFA